MIFMSQTNRNLERILLFISYDTNLNSILYGNNITFLVNEKLNKLIRELRLYLNVAIPSIQLVKSTFKHDPQNCRIIIVSDPTEIPSSFNFSKQSHIVIGIYNDNSNQRIVWHSDPTNTSDAIFYFENINTLVDTIVDLALDIIMSHYYRINAHSVSEGKTISKAKVDYKSQDKELNYISIASFYRKEGSIDLDAYCSDWENFHIFYKNYDKDKQINNTLEYKCNDVNVLFKKHPQLGQLSIKKLVKLITNLSPGNYLLIRAIKKPRKKRLQKAILNQLGCKHWKTGYIKVCNIKQYYNYNRYKKYLSIYPFKIE